MPLILVRSAIASSSSWGRLSRSSSPEMTRLARLRMYPAFCRDMPAARSCSSVAARSRLRSGGEPNVASSLAHIERAAATLTCWPTIVRSKVWAPHSLLRGSGTPCFSTTLANAGSRLASSSTSRRMLLVVLTMGGCRIERHSGGVRDVQALDRLADRQPGKGVAMLAAVVPEARAFRAEHECYTRRAKRVLEIGVGFASEADAPKSSLADFVEGSGKIDHPRPRHSFERSRRCLGQRSAFWRGVTVLGDDADRSEGRRRAQDRADVMRVGDLIEHEQHRAFVRAGQDLVQPDFFERFDFDDDTLMWR